MNLIDTNPHCPITIGFGQTRRLDQVDPMQAAHRDGATDIDQPRLLLGMHPDVIAPEPIGEFFAGRVQSKLRPLVQCGAESFGAELLGQITHTESPRFSRLPNSPKTWATPRHSSTA